MYDIITFGGAVVDAFLDTDIPQKGKDICYTSGSKIAVKRLEFSTGGGGTNTAATFANLGLKTGAIIKIGKDSNSELILKELKQRKITFLGKQEPGLTDFSVILDSKEHNRTILTFKEKSNSISYKDIPLNKLKTKWFYFASLDNISLKTQIKLASYSKRKGIKLAYNPSSYLTKKGPSYIKEILKHCDALILNGSEAKQLIKKGDLFKGLHKLGPKIVAITFGKKGTSVSNTKEKFTALPRKIKVKERTGAGDAFASGFVASLVKSSDLETAIIAGSLNAESVIQIPGAKNGLLTWQEMSKELKKSKIKIL
ncbi:MAG: carbohydrate kinase family protein [Nanoarchaeota archaeon]|nr:carbohydrate kinase family protein [Nanoarchaeota archaeon]MBU1051233.1 carbohydrate kinase family protein [Nanoarchaeota archaeon]